MTIIDEVEMAVSRSDLDAGHIDFSDVAVAGGPLLDPIPPGVLLRDEWLEPLGLSAYRLARDIGVPPNRMTAIVAGARAITADTALRLAAYFGTDAQSWMNLQTRYDLAVERHASGAKIAQQVRPRLPA